MTKFVNIYEVGPRDGLQNEKNNIQTNSKVRLVNYLSECGLGKIEVSSFVNSKWIPQLSDAKEVFDNINRAPKVKYTALIPNILGLNAAILSNVDEVAIFAAASETFSKKNINCSVDQSLTRFEPVISKARINNIPVRGYISCITDCPYEGNIQPQAVLNVAKRLLEMGCYQISLGDTIGFSTVETLEQLYSCLLNSIPSTILAGHFHDTNGEAFKNVEFSLEKGIRTFDSSVGGLGGCPYAPGAKGNVATETLAEFLNWKGYKTEVNQDKLRQASDFAKSLVSC